MLETGTKAPDFELPDQNGQIHRLSDYGERKLYYIFILRIILQDVPSRHVDSQRGCLYFLRKVRLYLG